MSDLALATEELALLHQLSGERGGRLYRLGFHAATLLPLLAFATFGVGRRDVLALGLAFAGLIGLYCWRLVAESRHIDVYRSLCVKVLAHQGSAPAA